jgi:hypothetical protein
MRNEVAGREGYGAMLKASAERGMEIAKRFKVPCRMKAVRMTAAMEPYPSRSATVFSTTNYQPDRFGLEILKEKTCAWF